MIHEGISSLLAGLLDNQIAYENCKWLLVDKKNSLWFKEFNEYSNQFLNYLKSLSNTLPNTFTDSRPYTKKLWEDLYKNYINKFNPTIPENIQEVRHLAYLFQDKFQSEINIITKLLNQTNQFQLSICCLSALFYQYSKGSIPSSIFVPLENHDKRNINNNDNYRQLIFRLLRHKPVERMKWLRVTRNKSLLVIAILIIIGGVGSGLFYVYRLVNIYVVNPSQLSPVTSLKDIITKCQNIELNSLSEDKNSSQTKEITECKKELDELLTAEENKLQKLKDNTEITPESNKTSIRLAETYKYLKNSFVSNYLPSQQDEDQYVLFALVFLKKSVRNDVKYNDILQPLKNCKTKDTRKEFEECFKELPRELPPFLPPFP